MCAHKERGLIQGSRSGPKRKLPMGYGGVVKLDGPFGDDAFSVSPRLSEHEGIRDDVNQHAFQLASWRMWRRSRRRQQPLPGPDRRFAYEV